MIKSNNNKKVNLGLIGLGSIGKLHLKNSILIEDANVMSVCDSSKKSLRYAYKIGIKKLFLNYEEMLKEKSLDAVVISLPTHLHKDCVLKAAEAKKDIFLEKPLARNEIEGKEILKIVNKNNIKIMVGYPFRFNQTFLNLKKKIKSRFLGDIQIANAINIGLGPLFHRSSNGIPNPVPSWWFNEKLSGGGVLIDLGCHLINILRWYFGEIVDIKGYLGYRFNLDIEDHAICLIRFKGLVSLINVGWFSQEPVIEIKLFGTLGHYSISPVYDFKGIGGKIKQFVHKRRGLIKDPYYKELEYFVKNIKYGLNLYPSIKDALRDLEAISMAYRSAQVIE